MVGVIFGGLKIIIILPIIMMVIIAAHLHINLAGMLRPRLRLRNKENTLDMKTRKLISTNSACQL